MTETRTFACEYCRCERLLWHEDYCEVCQHGHHVVKVEAKNAR